MDLIVFINSLFSWGQDMFRETLEVKVKEEVLQITKDAYEAHYLEADIRDRIHDESGFSAFPCTRNLTRTEIVSYVDKVTKGFNPIYADSLLEDIKQAGRLYCKKIMRITKYIQKYVLPITDDVFVLLTFDSFKATNCKACCEALGLDNSLYHYTISLLSRDTAQNLKNILPPELDTPQAREYLNRAQEAGFVAKTSTGYKWKSDNKSECSYFCDLCSDALKLSPTESRTNWKPFAALFGYKAEDLRGAKNGWKNKTGLPRRWKEIQGLFK